MPVDRRLESRMMCADLVQVNWTEPPCRARRLIANLEDISPAGACLQAEAAIQVGVHVRVSHGHSEFRGIVRYCVFREVGYFIGIEFEPGSKWSPAVFKPEHLFDPRELASS